MTETVFRPRLRFSLLLVLAVQSGCSDEQAKSPQSVESAMPDGIGLQTVDVAWLRTNTFFKVGSEKLTWRFEDTTVEITHDGQPLPEELVKEILKGPSHPPLPRKVTAFWELVEQDRKMRLFNMKVDDANTSEETELLIEGTGEAHLNLGTQQYRVRSVPVSGTVLSD